MQACLFAHLSSYETRHQANNATNADSSENDDILEFITEQTNWMPRISTDAPDAFCLDVPVQADANDPLELNRQLHTILQRKQDEISSLREKNSQLRELVRQAEHLARLLDTTAPSTTAAKQATACSPSSYGLGCSPSEQRSAILDQHQWNSAAAYESQHADTFSSVLPQTDQTSVFTSDSAQGPHSHGVKRCLWPSQDDIGGSASTNNSSAEDAGLFKRDAKRRKDDQELLQAQLQQYLLDIERDLQQEASAVSQDDQTEGQMSDMINVVGSFHGLKVVRTTLSANTVSSERGEAICFKTSVREHSTIRTRVFPHGKSFTSPAPTGGYRFLWIPTEQ